MSSCGEEVDNQQVERMLELANWAPTHRRTEPWRFTVYEGAAMDRLIDEICDNYVRQTPSGKFQPGFTDKMMERKSLISHLIVIGMKRNEILPEFEEIASVAMAVQNFWLYLSSLDGVGGYWSTPEYIHTPWFDQLVDLEEGARCMGLFYLGKLKSVNSKVEGHRKDWRSKVRWHKI